LQELESLYLERNPGASPLLAGKSLQAIEHDDAAIEAALRLFDLALSEGLIVFEGRKGTPTGRAPVGSCGMGLAMARGYYIEAALHAIMLREGCDPENMTKLLGGKSMQDVAQLHKVKLLTQFDPQTIKEMCTGLKGHLRGLVEKEEDYLNILTGCHPQNFVGILRKVLGKKFVAILHWTPEFLKAASESLDHAAKIISLGDDLLHIKDPDVMRAVGKWPMSEEKVQGSDSAESKVKFVTRIDQVRKVVGPEMFKRLLVSNPDVVRQAGVWRNQDLEQMKYFFNYLSPDTIEALSSISSDQQAGIMDGLWNRFGQEYLKIIFAHESGSKMVNGIVIELKSMGDSHSKDSVKALVVGDLFSKHFIGLPPMPANMNV